MISRCFRPMLLGLVCLGLATVHAELILTNFSAANPIKIMAIGDSITDDCSLSGAWRRYLQPLLETNGYPFTFIGRQQSTASGGFTKTRHEGYCGAVIAAPGVLTYSVYGYAGPDVYLQKIVRDALTNAKPDLVLVMMGANDLGRGRKPYQVATKDIPNLLDLIFSNAPNANVILNKALTLSNANVGGLNYGAYATNVPIYNSALQIVVNHRRALGQNVFLADMFSAVDYNTMFMSDHLHPNAAGLQAIAREWFARIQAITVRTNQFTSVLVRGGEIWKYSDTGEDLGTNWAQLDFDDSAWSSGPARLGYGDPAVITTVGFGPVATNRYITTYYRRTFVLQENVVVTNLDYRLARVDGAVVWLNGQEAFRTNMPAGPITYSTIAARTTTGEAAFILYPTNLPASNLRAGTNVIAVEIHLRLGTRVVNAFELELLGSGYFVGAPSLAIGPADGNVQLSWPVANSGGFTLYSTTNLHVVGSWTPDLVPLQTNGGRIVVTQVPDASARFFRLQSP